MPKNKSENKQARKKPERAVKGPEPERLKIEGDWVQAVDKPLAV